MSMDATDCHIFLRLQISKPSNYGKNYVMLYYRCKYTFSLYILIGVCLLCFWVRLRTQARACICNLMSLCMQASACIRRFESRNSNLFSSLFYSFKCMFQVLFNSFSYVLGPRPAVYNVLIHFAQNFMIRVYD